MTAPQDLGQLKQQWLNQPGGSPDVAAMRQRVAKDTQINLRTLALAGSITLLVIALSLAYAWRAGRTTAWVSFAFTAVFAATVWVVAVWLSRGTWHPRDESTAAYLDISIRRCRSVILAAPVGIVLYVLGVAGSLVWKQRTLGLDWSQLLESPPVILAGWIGTPLYTLGMLWNARRQQRRLTFLLNLKQQLGTG